MVLNTSITQVREALLAYSRLIRGQIFATRDLARIFEIEDRIRSLIDGSGDMDSVTAQLEDDISWLGGNNVSNSSVASSLVPHVQTVINYYRTSRLVVA
jgi:hypothetical protein